eukprot:g448.t1
MGKMSKVTTRRLSYSKRCEEPPSGGLASSLIPSIFRKSATLNSLAPGASWSRMTPTLTTRLAASLSPLARSLVGALLEAEVANRLSVSASAQHSFFEGLDVFTLHKRPRGPELPEIEKRPTERERATSSVMRGGSAGSSPRFGR